MKKFLRYPIILSTLILTACPGINYESSKDKLFKNKMDLPNPMNRYYSGIHFKLSELFQLSYNTDYVVKDNAETWIDYELNLHFSTEYFTKSDAKSYKFTFSEKVNDLNAVHDYYVLKRQNSLSKHFTSIKKPVAKSVGFNGLIQSIEGKNEYSDDRLMYLMATIEVDNKFYVFQLIGKKENMGYLNDDFLDILNSIEK